MRSYGGVRWRYAQTGPIKLLARERKKPLERGSLEWERIGALVKLLAESGNGPRMGSQGTSVREGFFFQRLRQKTRKGTQEHWRKADTTKKVMSWTGYQTGTAKFFGKQEAHKGGR